MDDPRQKMTSAKRATPEETKKARLEQALRANLRRRKEVSKSKGKPITQPATRQE